MKTLAILPVKSFGAAKQRLAESLGAGSRQALAQAMFADVLAALRRTAELDEIAVVTADRAAESAARGRRRRWCCADTDAGGAVAGRRRSASGTRSRTASTACCSCPATRRCCEPAELAELLGARASPGVVDRARPPRHRHQRARAHAAGRDRAELRPGQLRAARGAAPRRRACRCRVEEVPTLALDVDTPDDLAALSAELGAAPRPGARPRAARSRSSTAPAPAPRASLRPELVQRHRARAAPGDRGRATTSPALIAAAAPADLARRRRAGGGAQGRVEGGGAAAPAGRDRAGRAGAAAGGGARQGRAPRAGGARRVGGGAARRATACSSA